MSDKNKMIVCENLIKIYKTSDTEVVALQGLDLVVEEGELMAIIGNSGSGKSTLLNMLGGLDHASAGKLLVAGKDLFKLKEKEMMNYKRETVGFVWQNNARNLIPYLTAQENIELILGVGKQANKKARALELLEMVDMLHRKKSKLSQLSGGEQQRIAIAIALANNPKILLADEPTGSVDTKTAEQILSLFQSLNKKLNITIVIVTHDRALSKKVDRVVSIRDGKISTELLRKTSYAEALANLSPGLEEEESHVELAVIDNNGRIHIPEEYLSALNINGQSKLKVELEAERIVLYLPN